jgi:hypothetical protein
VGGGGATAIYFSSSPEPVKPDDGRTTADAARAHDAGVTVPAEASAPSSRLASLAGRWRSTSGRDFSAVLDSDDTLEFRIVQASQHARQGYEDGEVRFKLLPIAGAPDEFAVEDHLRPAPLAGFEYEGKASRDTCVGVWTAAKGKKLLAQFDGASQLTVDFVQIRTGPERFKTQGKRVVGCVDLTAAPAEPIESRLTRAQ